MKSKQRINYHTDGLVFVTESQNPECALQLSKMVSLYFKYVLFKQTSVMGFPIKRNIFTSYFLIKPIPLMKELCLNANNINLILIN